MKISGKKLKLAIKGAGFTQEEAANKLQMSRQTLSTYLRTDDLSDIFLQKVKTKLGLTFDSNTADADKPSPRLEAKPLHLASDPEEQQFSKFEDVGDGILRMRVPIIPVKAYAGYLRGWQDPEFYEGLPQLSIDVYKEYRGTYLAFEIAGDSMIPSDPADFELMALPGWKAIGREVLRHHWRYKLHTHKTDTWVIVHKTEGILIKNIVNHDVENGEITIHSLNPKYPDETFSLNDIDQIFSVVKYIIDK